jgi:hypothetical protein
MAVTHVQKHVSRTDRAGRKIEQTGSR